MVFVGFFIIIAFFGWKFKRVGDFRYGGVSWGNLFEEKVSPNPFQNLFGLRQPVGLVYMMKRGKEENSVEYG